MNLLLPALLFSGMFSSSEVPPNPSPITVVSYLTEQATPYCTESGRTIWADPHFEIGFVRVTASAVPLAPHVQRPIIVHGLVDHVLSPASSSRGRPGTCYIAQMRSDWVISRDGTRARRTPTLPFSTIAVQRAKAWKTLTASLQEDEIEISVRSPISRNIEVRTAIHYEGCMGKPGALAQEIQVSLDPGVDAKFRVPRVRVEGRGVYRAAALSMHALTKDTVFDVNIPLHHIGLSPVRCPTKQ